MTLASLQMLAGYFSYFSFIQSHLPFDLGLVPEPNQSFLRTLADIEMLFQTLSLCSGPPSALSETLEKMEKGKETGFPNDGSGGVFGAAQGLVAGRFGGPRGVQVGSSKGWLFALLVSWGLKSSVQQNSPSN